MLSLDDIWTGGQSDLTSTKNYRELCDTRNSCWFSVKNGKTNVTSIYTKCNFDRAVFKWIAVEKPKPKQLLRLITTGANSAMNQSQFLAIIWNFFKAREKSRVHGAIGFGFASHWLKTGRESFKPITKRINRNHVITFDSHLKTALNNYLW